MKNNNTADFFDRFAVTFDSFYDGKRNKIMQVIDQKFRNDIFERFALTFKELDEITNKTILDIGCGSGVYMFEALKKRARFVTGIDSAEGMLVLAKNKLVESDDFKGRYDLVLGNFPDVEVSTHDFAIVMGVMDYIENPFYFLAKLKEKTKIASLISFPSKHWFRTPLRSIRYRLRSCPVYFYDENKIRNLADQAGYKKIKIVKIYGAGLDYHVRIDYD